MVFQIFSLLEYNKNAGQQIDDILNVCLCVCVLWVQPSR